MQRGDPILLVDGMLRLDVLSVGATEIHCRMVVGGILTDNKGINLPRAAVAIPALADKDREDLVFGIRR